MKTYSSASLISFVLGTWITLSAGQANAALIVPVVADPIILAGRVLGVTAEIIDNTHAGVQVSVGSNLFDGSLPNTVTVPKITTYGGLSSEEVALAGLSYQTQVGQSITVYNSNFQLGFANNFITVTKPYSYLFGAVENAPVPFSITISGLPTNVFLKSTSTPFTFNEGTLKFNALGGLTPTSDTFLFAPVEAVPLPSSAFLLIGGLGLLGGMRRRKLIDRT